MQIPQLSLESFQEQLRNGAVLIDTRNYYQFIYGYIPGSVFLPVSPRFNGLLNSLFPQKNLLFLFEADGVPDAASAPTFFDGLRVAGTLSGGMDTWKSNTSRMDMVVEVDAYEFSIDLPFDDRLYIIDVRHPQLYAKEHVTGAYNMPLETFAEVTTLAAIEENWNLYIYGERNEGATAVSLLQRQGFYNARNISEGYSAIRKEKAIPLEKEKPNLSNGTSN